MSGETDIAGVLIHPLLIAAIVAFVLAEATGWLISRAGLYRFVWHRGLFDVAMTIILWALVVAVLAGAPLASWFG